MSFVALKGRAEGWKQKATDEVLSSESYRQASELREQDVRR